MTTTNEARSEARPFAGVGRLIEECLGKICNFERATAETSSPTTAEALPEQLRLTFEETPEALQARLDEAKLNYEQARSLFMNVTINPHPDEKWVRKVRRRAVKAWHEYENAYSALFYLGDGSIDADLRP